MVYDVFQELKKLKEQHPDKEFSRLSLEEFYELAHFELTSESPAPSGSKSL